MSKLTLNSSQEDIFQYLGLDENKEAYLWYKEKENDIKKMITYCSIKDLDFCLEDDFDIYFSDSFERVGINNYFGFTAMREKTYTYEYFVTIRLKYCVYEEHIGQIRECFYDKKLALEMAEKLWVSDRYSVVIVEHKIDNYGEVVDINTEVIK